MAGWMGLDPAGDDNPDCKYGRWPFEAAGPRPDPKPPAEKPAATPAAKTP